VTLDSEAAIAAARAAYDALTEEQKALVSNYQTLLEDEAELARLKAEAAAAAALEQAKDAAKQAAQAYAEVIGALDLDEEAAATLAELLEQGLADIDAAESIEDVETILEALLAAMDGLRPEEPPFQFDDVQDPSKYYYDAVYWAVNHEPPITTGTSATTFGPKVQCTRAQVMTFLYAAAGQPEVEAETSGFDDVNPGSYYEKPVIWAVENGLTTGTSPTTFSPKKVCTRAEIMTFLYIFAGSPEVPEGTENPFTDVKPGAYYEKAVLWAVQEGITTGTSATTFAPKKACTRAEIVTFLYKLLG
jgi:hypothetical protein